MSNFQTAQITKLAPGVDDTCGQFRATKFDDITWEQLFYIIKDQSNHIDDRIYAARMANAINVVGSYIAQQMGAEVS